MWFSGQYSCVLCLRGLLKFEGRCHPIRSHVSIGVVLVVRDEPNTLPCLTTPRESVTSIGMARPSAWCTHRYLGGLRGRARPRRRPVRPGQPINFPVLRMSKSPARWRPAVRQSRSWRGPFHMKSAKGVSTRMQLAVGVQVGGRWIPSCNENEANMVQHLRALTRHAAHVRELPIREVSP